MKVYKIYYEKATPGCRTIIAEDFEDAVRKARQSDGVIDSVSHTEDIEIDNMPEGGEK